MVKYRRDEIFFFFLTVYGNLNCRSYILHADEFFFRFPFRVRLLIGEISIIIVFLYHEDFCEDCSSVHCTIKFPV